MYASRGAPLHRHRGVMEGGGHQGRRARRPCATSEGSQEISGGDERAPPERPSASRVSWLRRGSRGAAHRAGELMGSVCRRSGGGAKIWRAYWFILLLVNFLFFYHSCKTLNLARIIPPTFGIDVSREKLYAILVHGPTAQGYMIIWIWYSRMELTVYGISVWRRMLGYI